MNEERRRILKLLADGKVTAEEAESLLEATDSVQPSATAVATPVEPKYLRVIVEEHNGEHSGKVNVRVPLDLLRAGVRLAALLPSVAYGPINRALKESGVDIDVSKVKAKDWEEIVQHLRELAVDVDGDKGEKVRVFCE